jgi:nitrogen regulatory protein P-II 2
MNTHTLTLLTIVAETLLKDRLIHEVRQAGAKGFTITEVSGEGSRQRRVSEILGDNIKVEVITKREVAESILDVLQRDFFPRYAVVAYMSEVQVVRENKYQ